MTPRCFRDLVLRAAAEPDGQTMDQLITLLSAAERAREIVRAKGYGASGMSGSATAAQVPAANTERARHRAPAAGFRKACAVTDEP